MDYGLFTFIVTILVSTGISATIILSKDRQYKKSLNGNSLDEFGLWMEQLQSEIDVTDRINEYEGLFMTMVIIIMAYAKRVRPYRLRQATQ